MTEPADDITLDGLLGQQIRLRQPRQSYRAGSDAILLAATVPARPGQTVLDAGAGVGAIALCLAHRCRQVTVRGLELQPRLAELANENAQANSLADRVSVHQGDIRRAPSEIAQARFDHTVCNPPFHPEGRSSPSPDDGKALAHGEGETPLADWLA
ncbi:MAG: methyltransferase, partial [Alphaproteobacteria bacterium]|nr:methyltransferase [Alphaproteobacteria bacterium]